MRGIPTSGEQERNGRVMVDALLPDGMNLNQELVKHGWCWW
jgi:hypothetical protein